MAQVASTLGEMVGVLAVASKTSEYTGPRMFSWAVAGSPFSSFCVSVALVVVKTYPLQYIDSGPFLGLSQPFPGTPNHNLPSSPYLNTTHGALGSAQSKLLKFHAMPSEMVIGSFVGSGGGSVGVGGCRYRIYGEKGYMNGAA